MPTTRPQGGKDEKREEGEATTTDLEGLDVGPKRGVLVAALLAEKLFKVPNLVGGALEEHEQRLVDVGLVGQRLVKALGQLVKRLGDQARQPRRDSPAQQRGHRRFFCPRLRRQPLLGLARNELRAAGQSLKKKWLGLCGWASGSIPGMPTCNQPQGLFAGPGGPRPPTRPVLAVGANEYK